MTKLDLAEIVKERYTPLKITTEAFAKANYLSQRVCELAEQPLELSFFLLGKAEDMVIRDIYLGREQNVNASFCEISESGVIGSVLDIQENYDLQILGWGHSHACWNNFYSNTDTITLKERERLWGVLKEVEISEDYLKNINLENSNEQYQSLDLDEGLINIFSEPVYSESALTTIDSYSEEMIVGLFQGMTFNAKADEPYCVVAYSQRDEEPVLLGELDYEIIEAGNCNYSPETNKQVLDEQLKERVIGLHYLLGD